MSADGSLYLVRLLELDVTFYVFTTMMEAEVLLNILALIVSFLTACVIAYTAYIQREHNRLSVRPIASISLANYENRVGVYLKNNGLGPLKVEDFTVISNDGKKTESIIKQMPEGILWTTFSGNIQGYTLDRGKSFDLLELSGDENDPGFICDRNKVRKKLSTLKLTVRYSDLYGQEQEPVTRSLTWFEGNVDT